MKTHKDTDRHPTDLKSARMNYPNSTMQPFVLQNASVDFQYPKPALSYMVSVKVQVIVIIVKLPLIHFTSQP